MWTWNPDDSEEGGYAFIRDSKHTDVLHVRIPRNSSVELQEGDTVVLTPTWTVCITELRTKRKGRTALVHYVDGTAGADF